MQKRILWLIGLFCLQAFPQYIYESNQSLIDLTNETQVTWLTSGDDSISNSFGLGFDFTFYDQTFSTARMATNGCLHFGSTGSGCNDYTPDPLAQFNYTIYPFWTDLIAVDANAKMAAKNFSDKIVFGWYKMQEYYRTNSYNSFEVILWNNNTYDIRYGDLDIVDHDVLIGEQGDSTQTYTYYFHDECNTGSYNGSDCYSYDWNSSDKNTNLESGGSLYGEGNGIDCSDPLNDSSCNGYEQAYLTQQCNLDSLYSTECPGYAQAYQDQQCDLDALYSTECNGYAQAYQDQQCSLDALYSTECSGYEAAYQTQQCNIDALYSTECNGYEQAFFDQQCSLDSLYDTTCPGYEQAYRDYECEQDSQYSPTCSGYVPEAAAIVVIQTAPMEYETFQIIENESVVYEEPVQDIYIEEFYFEEPATDPVETFDPAEEVFPEVDVFDGEEMLEIFTTNEQLEEIEEFIEEEPIEDIFEETFVEEEIFTEQEIIVEAAVEEIIEEEIVEEIIQEEVLEEVVENFEDTPKKNSIAAALKVVAQTMRTAANSYTTQNNIGNNIEQTSGPIQASQASQTSGISTSSSPSISDQILSANVQTNTVLSLNDTVSTISDNTITITPLFTIDDTQLADVQINNIQDEIMSATSTVMTASEADKIADQILANNLKQEQEEIEEEQQESGEYADQTTLVAYLGFVPGFNAYTDLSLEDRETWYESKDIYKNAIIFDNTEAYNNMAGSNIGRLQNMIDLQVDL